MSDSYHHGDDAKGALPQYTVRPAGIDDARAISEVLACTWGEAYAEFLAPDVLARQTNVENRYAVVAAHIDDANKMTYVLERAGHVCGMIGLRFHEDAAEVEACYVRASDWGRGAGRRLMECALAAACERTCRAVGLWVLKENVRARAFYERCGFVSTGKEENLPYKARDGIDWAIEVRYELRF